MKVQTLPPPALSNQNKNNNGKKNDNISQIP